MNDDEKKSNIRKLFSDSKPAMNANGVHLDIKGAGNIAAGGDINGVINYNSRPIIKSPFTPGAEHITPAQARKIQELVSTLVSKEVAGGLTNRQAFSKWYNALKSRYRVNSYKAIPRSLGDEVISWLRQQGAIKRSKIRRRNPNAWRNELYSAIWARSKELGISKGGVYGIVLERLGKRVSSLTQIGEEDLKKLHAIIMSIRI